MNGSVEAYIEQLMRKNDPLFEEMASFANSEHIPIMDSIGMETLCQMLRIQKPESVLEIGTAIGYSALKMADALPDVKIVTIEREEERVAQANAYFARTPLSRRIRLLKGDALCGDVIQKTRELGRTMRYLLMRQRGSTGNFLIHLRLFCGKRDVYTRIMCYLKALWYKTSSKRSKSAIWCGKSEATTSG